MGDIISVILFTTLIILLLIAGIVIIVFITNKKRLQQETKMAQMQLDYEKELRVVADEVQEQVLVNVGRELHDNIGQLLTVMHIQVEHGKLDKPELGSVLAPIDDTLQSAIQQLRALAKSLNNDVLEHDGLLHAIQQEVNRLQLVGQFSLRWEHDSMEPQLNKDQRLMTFRILQEVLNNAMKHADAKNIEISMNSKNGFALVVKDDGKGFDADKQLNSAAGSGLKNIMKRAALANLNCRIESYVGKGSIFTLQETDA